MTHRNIRLLSALSAPLLAASLPLSAHAASTPAETPKLTCTTADEWTALFDRAGQSGWLGADGIYSVALDGNDAYGSAGKSTTTLFFFSDTLIGKANSTGRVTQTDPMPNHTAALLSGGTPDPNAIEFVYGYKGNTASRTKNIFRDDQWLFDCFYLNGSVYLFGFNQVDWKPAQIDMIEVPVTDGQADFSHYVRTKNITQLLTITPDKHYDFGMGILNNTADAGAPDPDGYIYFYGFIDNLHEFSRKDLIVARIAADDFPDFTKLTYFDGEGWGSDPTKSAVLIPNVSCETSVSPITGGPYKGKYIAVYTEGVQTAHMMYAIGDSPIGPFSDPVEFYTAPETGAAAKGGNGTLYTYNAKAHPHLSTDGKLLVSYNVNDNYGLAGHTYDYHPRFLWLDLRYTDEEIAALQNGKDTPDPADQTTGTTDPGTANPPVTTNPAVTNPAETPAETTGGVGTPGEGKGIPWAAVGVVAAGVAAATAGVAVFLAKRKKRGK